ncbi:MAG: hypothetical protein DHS20C18_26500 [Saprospiraceae bacterium]|nr:MAG: hypothetical protein DHS20C18_26500 [Saprospiraceae bacterium]
MKKRFLGLSLVLCLLSLNLAFASTTLEDLSLYPYSDQDTLEVGDQYCVEIRVDGFVNVAGFQFTVSWNPEALQFDSLLGFNVPGLDILNFGLPPLVDDGVVTTSWNTAFETPVTLSDGSHLVKVCFTVLPDAEFVNTVQIAGVPTAIEFFDNMGELFNVIPGSSTFYVPDENLNLSVWPGDTDLSEIVDNFDLLNIGLAYGETGPTRPNASAIWQQQLAAQWTYSTPNSTINAAHIDTDGNGIINDADVQAVEQNWGETTNFGGEDEENRLTPLPEALTLADPAIIVEPQTVNPGQEATFNILFGDETTLAEGVYGLAFTVVYDPVAVVSSSVSASFSDSWLGDENGELIKIFRDRPEDNRLDIAISRINQQNRDGQGAIAQINLTIAEILQEENYPMAFEIENPRIINVQEQLIPALHPITFSEIMGTTATGSPELSHRVNLYPIPARDLLQLSTDDLIVDAIELLSPEGKVVQRWEQALTQIPISILAPGTYILQLFTREGMVQKRFVKL